VLLFFTVRFCRCYASKERGYAYVRAEENKESKSERNDKGREMISEKKETRRDTDTAMDRHKSKGMQLPHCIFITILTNE